MKKENQTNKRVILHADANNFYASVECLTNPSLKNKPVAVTGNPEKRTYFGLEGVLLLHVYG